MEWWPFLIFHRGGLRIKVINNNVEQERGQEKREALFCGKADEGHRRESDEPGREIQGGELHETIRARIQQSVPHGVHERGQEHYGGDGCVHRCSTQENEHDTEHDERHAWNLRQHFTLLPYDKRQEDGRDRFDLADGFHVSDERERVGVVYHFNP